MRSLEETFREVEKLGRDLSAEKVIQEEIWENGEEILGDSSWNYGMPTGKYEKDKIVQPGITEPDTQKRETARKELQQIYDNNEWYSVRYEAGRTLNVGKEELKNKLVLFIEELYKTFNIPDKKTRKNAKKDLRYLYKNLSNRRMMIKAGKALGYSRLRIWLHELFR